MKPEKIAHLRRLYEDPRYGAEFVSDAAYFALPAALDRIQELEARVRELEGE